MSQRLRESQQPEDRPPPYRRQATAKGRKRRALTAAALASQLGAGEDLEEEEEGVPATQADADEPRQSIEQRAGVNADNDSEQDHPRIKIRLTLILR